MNNTYKIGFWLMVVLFIGKSIIDDQYNSNKEHAKTQINDSAWLYRDSVRGLEIDSMYYRATLIYNRR